MTGRKTDSAGGKPVVLACDHCGGEASQTRRGAGDEIRCACGSLLARQVPGGIELKCRRCKRSLVVSFGQEQSSDSKSAVLAGKR